jgi:hypothetical protein
MRKKMKVTEKDLGQMDDEQLLKEGRQAVTAFFADWPGSDADEKCHAIFEQHGGEFLNCGTWLGPPPERDVEYAVPLTQLKACKAALEAAGFRFETFVVVH